MSQSNKRPSDAAHTGTSKKQKASIGVESISSVVTNKDWTSLSREQLTNEWVMLAKIKAIWNMSSN